MLSFRATDTLLEAVVLVFALIAVWSLAPDRVWGGRPGLRYDLEANGMLAYLARLLPPLGIIVAIYVFWVGASCQAASSRPARCWRRCGCWPSWRV